MIKKLAYIAAFFCLTASLPAIAAPKAFKEEMTDEDLGKNDAQYQCVQFITKTLDDPYQAKFEYFGSFPAKQTKDGYTVEATYKENESAPQKKAECALKKNAAGDLELISITPLK